MDTWVIVSVGEIAVSTDLFFAAIIPLAIWPEAIYAGNGLSRVKMQWMRIRIYPPEPIIHSLGPAFSSGGNESIERLEMYFLAGANVSPINYTLTATSKAGSQQMYQAFASEELSGRRKLELKKSI
jgi:uncharacterized protein YqfA (UPF0365 family)